jgi:hypothetical protein
LALADSSVANFSEQEICFGGRDPTFQACVGPNFGRFFPQTRESLRENRVSALAKDHGRKRRTELSTGTSESMPSPKASHRQTSAATTSTVITMNIGRCGFFKRVEYTWPPPRCDLKVVPPRTSKVFSRPCEREPHNRAISRSVKRSGFLTLIFKW